jgi:hypothetical protein
VVTSSTVLSSLSNFSHVICKTIPIIKPVFSTSTSIITNSIPYVTPVTGKPLLNNSSLSPSSNLLTSPTRNHHLRNNGPFGLRKPMPGYYVHNFIHFLDRCHFHGLPYQLHHDQAEHLHDFFGQQDHEVCYFFGGQHQAASSLLGSR